MWMLPAIASLPRAVLRFSFMLAVLGLAVNAAHSQNSTGSLRGIVDDASRGRIRGARVVVREAESSRERSAASDSRGEFRLDNLLPGFYRVMVSAQGFAEAQSVVAIEVSSVCEISITLGPASLQQGVSVQGSASSITTQPIETSSAVHQGIVTLSDLQNLPLAERTFANIAYLVPGTEPVEPSDPTKARITAVSFGGSSGLNVQLSVDGGDNNDDYIGGFLQNYSPDAMQEFVVRTAQFDADTSRTNGGSVIISTRRGSDDWHGDFGYYLRARAFNARN